MMSTAPEGFVVIPNFLSDSEERALVKELLDDNAPWLDKSHLRFSNTSQQEYGASISDAMEVTGGKSLPIPPTSFKLARRIAGEAARLKLSEGSSFVEDGSGFLRVNYYAREGGGYMHKHMDSHKCFGPVIACCSLLADAAMTFYDTKGNSYGMARVHRTVEVKIPRRSLYFMAGPARYQWQHGIRKDQCPVRRLSLTFGTIRTDAPIATKNQRKLVPAARAKANPKASGLKQTILKRPSKHQPVAMKKSS